MDGYCDACALNRCDCYPDECPVKYPPVPPLTVPGRARVEAQAAEKVRAVLDVLRSPGPTLGGWRLSPKDHHHHCASRTTAVDGKVPDCDCYAVAHQPGRDALSSLAAELVSLKDALERAEQQIESMRRYRETQEGLPTGTLSTTHGRRCPCTPCRAEDWDAIDAGIVAAREALGRQE